MVTGGFAGERMKIQALQDDIAARIGEHQLVETIAAVLAGAGDGKGGHAVGDRPQDARRIALLLGEEALPVGDDEAEIPRARVIDARIVDLVQDAVAEREPDLALRGESRAHAALRARGPARRDPGGSRGGRKQIAHRRSGPRETSPRPRTHGACSSGWNRRRRSSTRRTPAMPSATTRAASRSSSESTVPE